MQSRFESNVEAEVSTNFALNSNWKLIAFVLRNAMPRPEVAWIDGVGGFAMVASDRVSIGRQGDLAIIGNLPRISGTLSRSGEDWFWTDGDSGDASRDDQKTLLGDQETLPLGGGVVCKICRPGFLTATRRLELSGPHRWAGGIDSVLLIAKIATIGPTPSDSIRALHLDQTHFLSTTDNPMQLRCQKETAPLVRNKSVTVGTLTMMVRSWDV